MRHFVAALFFPLAGLVCLPTQAQNAPEKSLMAEGSGSMEQIVALWRDEYRKQRPGFDLEVRPSGSNAAPKALEAGKVQMALMSREMTREEVASFSAKHGYSPTRIAVAMDALVVLVNRNNPIREIRIEALDALYSTTRLQGWPRDVQTWGDLGLTQAQWEKRPVVRWGRPDTSGTRQFFVESVMLGGTPKGDTRRSQEEAGLTEELIANQSAIGYGSLSEVFGSLKAVPIVPKGSKVAEAPTVENVAAGSYPLARFLFIYVNKAPGKPLPAALQSFLGYALSTEGQGLLRYTGQVALPDDLLRLNRRRLQ